MLSLVVLQAASTISRDALARAMSLRFEIEEADTSEGRVSSVMASTSAILRPVTVKVIPL